MRPKTGAAASLRRVSRLERRGVAATRPKTGARRGVAATRPKTGARRRYAGSERRDAVRDATRELRRRLAPFGVVFFGGLQPSLAASSEWPEFDAIRDELEGKGTGGLAFMQTRLERGEYAELLEFTKQWDLDFRKAVLGKARKAMPKGPDRDRAVLVANAVTFDLIGINKAIRATGKEDAAEAKRWFNTLVDDIQDFATLQPTGARPPPE